MGRAYTLRAPDVTAQLAHYSSLGKRRIITCISRNIRRDKVTVLSDR